MAACINAVSAENGRRLAEVRSYKDRGIEREPQRHEGPQVSDKLDRVDSKATAITGGVFSRLKANAIGLRKRLEREAIEGASIQSEDIPKRYRKGWFGGVWLDRLRQINKRRTAGQDESSQNAVYDDVTAFVSDWPQQAPEPIQKAQEMPAGPPPFPPTDTLRPQVRQSIKEAARQLEAAQERQSRQPITKHRRRANTER